MEDFRDTPRAAMREIYERMIMHFLYDYFRDVQRYLRNALTENIRDCI
jgi:hypothetical protein